jgi:phosphotransferase system IIB component
MGLLLPVQLPAAQEKPLPDTASFMAEFRKTLHSDDKLLSQYTYTEKETSNTLDSKGNIKKSEINVYQVFNAEEDWKSYSRQIVKNGVPVSEKELEKKDREEKERVEKETIKRGKKSESERQKDKAKADREEQEILDDVFAMYDLQLVRRDILNGISTILVTFKPKAGFKPKTKEGRILQHIGGSAWIAEDDHELARLEAEVVDTISIGAGILAKLNKGSTLVFERRKINGEIWLPVKAEATLNAKVLLLKGYNLREVSEYSEHKKFGVDVQLIFGEIADKPPQ